MLKSSELSFQPLVLRSALLVSVLPSTLPIYSLFNESHLDDCTPQGIPSQVFLSKNLDLQC